MKAGFYPKSPSPLRGGVRGWGRERMRVLMNLVRGKVPYPHRFPLASRQARGSTHLPPLKGEAGIRAFPTQKANTETNS
jgi:hypothetical protein